MKKIKIILAILFIVLGCFILTGCGVDNKETNNVNNKSNDIKEKSVIDPKNLATLYIVKGNEEIQHELGYNGELKPIKLIDGISELLGYKISVNSAEITDKGMVIDFKKESSPFSDDTYIGAGTEMYEFTDYTALAFCIFDSIKTTMQNNYDEDLDVFMTLEGKAIKLDRTSPKLELSLDKPYMGSEYYLK